MKPLRSPNASCESSREESPPHELFAEQQGFRLELGAFDFVYRESERKLTIPVEMLMRGHSLWEIARSVVVRWDDDLDGEEIDDEKATEILNRIRTYVELTGKAVRVV